MTGTGHPIAHVIGAVLSDARQHARLPLAEAARRLGTHTEQLADLESGRRPATRGELRRLCRLYGVTDHARALEQLAEGPPAAARAEPRTDRDHTFADRLAAVARQSVRVRWMSTHLLPPPLHTPAYSAAVHQPTPARPWPQLRDEDIVVLDEHVLRRGGATAGLMREQIGHLLALLNTGAQIHIVPELFPPGSYAELTLPDAVTIVVTGGFADAVYQATTALATHIDRALDQPDTDRSKRLLTEAYHHHTLREVR
ncbi:Scr1 family TA system antitoxin-like transcriptional regulator [Streptomyces sp. CFMR 7]|uniref:Scr1 family TA system antitoxin-like transcriptional regulator n=1 Tax=Streptomyces sp. CFMR 7 TaxID=1649184 RepID=UPI0011A0C5FB|nr:Scr1 family TA system antitoxin-like transcriptional regulator [Streptomyces sp. CFMR 7]